MRALSIIDPEGVERRKKLALKRRRYTTSGPIFLWHVDGWDNLSPFGIFIHGAVDGFSRRTLWMEVNSTNKDPKVIAEGVPRRIRCNWGTENTIIRSLQQFFRRHDVDDFGQWKGKFTGGQKFWESAYRSLVVQIS